MESKRIFEEKPVLDKIDLFLPPRITLKIAAIATEKGQSINEILLTAIDNYLKKCQQ